LTATAWKEIGVDPWLHPGRQCGYLNSSDLQEHYAKATAARKLVVARRLMDEQHKLGTISFNPTGLQMGRDA
jgi:hypothetical protein